jgi:hypothetical protein
VVHVFKIEPALAWYLLDFVGISDATPSKQKGVVYVYFIADRMRFNVRGRTSRME